MCYCEGFCLLLRRLGADGSAGCAGSPSPASSLTSSPLPSCCKLGMAIARSCDVRVLTGGGLLLWLCSWISLRTPAASFGSCIRAAISAGGPRGLGASRS